MLLQSFIWSKRLISWKMRVLFRSKRLNTCSIWYCHSGESYSPEQTATVEQFIDTLQGISLFLCYLFLCDCGFSKHLFYCANVGCIMSIFPNYVTCYSLIGQPSLKFDNYMREKIPSGVCLAYSMIVVFLWLLSPLLSCWKGISQSQAHQ
jgi:hypothetical protein